MVYRRRNVQEVRRDEKRIEDQVRKGKRHVVVVRERTPKVVVEGEKEDARTSSGTSVPTVIMARIIRVI